MGSGTGRMGEGVPGVMVMSTVPLGGATRFVGFIGCLIDEFREDRDSTYWG